MPSNAALSSTLSAEDVSRALLCKDNQIGGGGVLTIRVIIQSIIHPELSCAPYITPLPMAAAP